MASNEKESGEDGYIGKELPYSFKFGLYFPVRFLRNAHMFLVDPIGLQVSQSTRKLDEKGRFSFEIDTGQVLICFVCILG